MRTIENPIKNTKWAWGINIFIAMTMLFLQLHMEGSGINSDGTIDETLSRFDFSDLLYVIILLGLVIGGNFIIGIIMGAMSAKRSYPANLQETSVMFMIYLLSSALILYFFLRFSKRLDMALIATGQQIAEYLIGYPIYQTVKERKNI
ncbi:MAG: hypothetical protein PHP50_01875 [Lachnospiraceae bacterium]|nr:hypothetical protein [Lachnospiraceae bacterium]